MKKISHRNKQISLVLYARYIARNTNLARIFLEFQFRQNAEANIIFENCCSFIESAKWKEEVAITLHPPLPTKSSSLINEKDTLAKPVLSHDNNGCNIAGVIFGIS